MAKKTVKAPTTPGAVTWLERPQEHDYPAAASYLRLIATADVVTALVDRLREAPIVTAKAKDILRAATLPLLETTNPHVASDLRKIAAGSSLSPILVVRGFLGGGLPLQVADGYHRVCACYHTDENIDIPLVVVDL